MEHIGRYEILRELGRGGFGRVYLANDPLIQCQVAIKVISQADDPEMLARFRDEAAAARKLHHASIVTIYDVGEDHGVPYIVMDYLQGTDLQKLLDQNAPLSLVDKVRILSEVAAGLQVAHENGIIHRDIKPANIMVLKHGGTKIMDFGIARLNREGATRLTRTGYLPCTLQYTAPEQVTDGFPTDAMTDLWAFGVTAFQMFSGKNPFAATEPAQVIYNITSLPLPDLRQLNPETPEDLCELVRKLLDRDRAKRFQTFEDLRVHLNPVLESLELQEADRLVEDAGAMEARGDVQGARRLVSKVLERFPSNTRAQGIRNLIMTRIRLDETAKQVAELLQKGDKEFSARSYEEALHAYRQADRLSPGSSTVQIRMERAQQMAERTRRILEEMQQARAQLAAGDPREAQRILAGIIADDPDNTDAPGLMRQALQERERQDDAARADAILCARELAAQLQFAQAIELLASCARKTGNHAALLQAEEEVRRAEKEAAARARVEGAISKANEHIRKGEYTAASRVLAPVAAAFPDNSDIQERLKFVAQEEARVRRETEQRAAVERAAAERGAVTEALREPPLQPDKANEARVIEQALKMSREHELCGRLADAVHILDVALSRYPDAAELMNERRRLLTPVPQAAPASSNRRMLWLGIGAVGVLLCAVMGYRLYSKPTVSLKPPLASLLLPSSVTFVYQPGIPSSEKTWNVGRSDLHAVVEGTQTWLAASASGGRVVLRLNDAAAGSLAPGDYKEAVQVTSNRETGPLDVTLKVPKPALAPLRLPEAAPFVYHNGDPPVQRVLKVERADLSASVVGSGGPKTWLAASATPGQVILSLKPVAAGSLAPGEYKETVQVTSNGETALAQVLLRVEAPGLPPLLVSDAAPFVYRKGDPPSVQFLKTNRPDVRVPVMGPKTWLAASASAGRVTLRLDADVAATLAPGNYKDTVQVAANGETALVQVSLKVEPVKEVVKTPAKIVATPAKADPCATTAEPGAVVKKSYNGSRRGTVNWSGSLPSGACLVLGESGVLEGGGTLTGDEIPPTDVQVETVPRGLETRTLAPTGDQRIVIKNSTEGPLNRIRIDWSIKTP